MAVYRISNLVLTLFCFFGLFSPVTLGWMDVNLAPNGGFSPLNKNRIRVYDGHEAKPYIGHETTQFIKATKDGGQIRIAMYSFDQMHIVDQLVEAANRNIMVKLLLDASADYTKFNREKILNIIKKGAENAKGPFDFQVRIVPKEIFENHGRTRILDNGIKIYGSFHEKIGLFKNPNENHAFALFAGSANMSTAASTRYGENRLIFTDEEEIIKAYEREFAFVWNLYGVDTFGDPVDEIIRPLREKHPAVQLFFNSQGHKISQEIIRLIENVSDDGTVDIGLYSFTLGSIAEKIIEVAQKKPNAKFRLLMDNSQIKATESTMGVIAPWIEEQAQARGLKNIEIRYKWRSNAFGVVNDKLDFLNYKSLLFHHKFMIVDGRYLATGSYNWSESAEIRNLENLIIADGEKDDGAYNLVFRFQLEFDLVWNRLREDQQSYIGTFSKPQVVSGEFGRKLGDKIRKSLNDPKLRSVFAYLEPLSWKGADLISISSDLDLSRREALNLLNQLRELSLIRARFEKDRVIYCEAD